VIILYREGVKRLNKEKLVAQIIDVANQDH
jgi:hypothetical protein